jgi:hypothetical protein
MPNTLKVKIWSDLHGDMQSRAEMTRPPVEQFGSPAVTNVSVPILHGRRSLEESCP